MRIEQLYPLPEAQLKEVLSNYPREANVVWCQEEPRNRATAPFAQIDCHQLPLTECCGAEGAFNFIRQQFLDDLDDLAMPSYVGRRSSGAASEGVGAWHRVAQEQLVAKALSLGGDDTE